MKTVKILLAALLMFSASSAMAQKFASVKQSEIIQKLTIKDSTQQKLKTYYDELMEVAEGMNVEFQNKLADFQKNQASLSEVVRAQKEKDLQRLNASLEEFQQTSQQNIQLKQQELMAPIFEKYKAAVTKVGKEANYTVIFDADTQVFINESQVTNITDLVVKALGL